MAFWLAFALPATAQTDIPWEDVAEEVVDEMGDVGGEATVAQEALVETLGELAAEKINLNAATREDLERLPFLSEQQIADLADYLYRYAPLRSLGELAMVESIDAATRRLLLPFVELGHEEEGRGRHFPPLPQLLRYGHSQLTATARIPLYQRHGDQQGYLGYPYRHSLRYTWQHGRYAKAGFVAAQDAGEPFFAGQNRWGYDFYSCFVVLQRLGRLKTLAVGRYRLRLGMGLALNGDVGFGKRAALSALGRRSSRLRAHSSRMEAGYMQGAAATVALSKGLDATAFVSYRPIDATLNVEDGTVATILTTGYHRTPSEMERRRNTRELTAGGNVNYEREAFHLGMTAVYTRFNRVLRPNTAQRYRLYYAAGQRFWNVSVDYGLKWGRVTMDGETATGGQGAWATLNRLSWRATGDVSLVALQRFYSYRYVAIHGESFSEGGRVNNESGVYVGAEWRPVRGMELKAYTDVAYFPWAKYQAARASKAWDNLVEARWNRGAWTVAGRYRIKMRQKDNDDKTALIWKTVQRGRLGATWERGAWRLKTQGDVALSHYGADSFGWMVSEQATWTRGRWAISATVGYFDTDDYESRIYSYERNPLYSMSFPMFYGEGLRATLFVRGDVSQGLMLIAKIGRTRYFDRHTIGTGLQQIDGRSQTDVDVQLRWKF